MTFLFSATTIVLGRNHRRSHHEKVLFVFGHWRRVRRTMALSIHLLFHRENVFFIHASPSGSHTLIERVLFFQKCLQVNPKHVCRFTGKVKDPLPKDGSPVILITTYTMLTFGSRYA